MPEEIRRKKKVSKKKTQSGDSTIVLAIVAAVFVVIGITVTLIVVSKNRRGGNTKVDTIHNPSAPVGEILSTASAPAAGAASAPTTGAGAAPTMHIPVVTAEAIPLQDQPVSDKDELFEVRLPVGWERGDERLFVASPFGTKLSGSADAHREPDISVIPAMQLSGTTPKVLAERTLETFRKAGHPILANQPAKISGYDAWRMIHEDDVPAKLLKTWNLPPDEKARHLTYWVGPVNYGPTDNKVFIITMSAHNDDDRFQKLVPTFEAIMSTFRIRAEVPQKQ